ncbi:TerB family tellurite resistance protein, partial [Roseomonas sp. DSM 102946]|nr:TerB family tellurite resistance protein [Roseomonas sp. DSM 102946]
MSFWGKIIGSALGFAVGGPFGAMLGASLGHAADEGALRGALPGGANLAGLLGARETVFAIAVVVLSAKLAKCDGPVRRAEIAAFKTQFRIPPENMK